jgi:hypothetical protein
MQQSVDARYRMRVQGKVPFQNEMHLRWCSRAHDCASDRSRQPAQLREAARGEVRGAHVANT